MKNIQIEDKQIKGQIDNEIKNKEIKSFEWLHYCFIAIPIILAVYYWNLLPEQMAVHFAIDGTADNYMDKIYAIFIIPGLSLILYVLLKYAPLIDPKKNFDKFKKTFIYIRLGLTAFLSLIGVFLVLYGVGIELAVGKIVPIIVLLFFILLGNLMSRFRPNYFIGIRTPWTLESEEVWMKTHRLGAKLWTYGSIIMIPIVIYIDEETNFYIFIFYIAVIALIPLAYSYIYHRRLKKEGFNID